VILCHFIFSYLTTRRWEFKIFRGGKKAKSRRLTSGFWQALFGLFGDQLERIPWDTYNPGEKRGPGETPH